MENDNTVDFKDKGIIGSIIQKFLTPNLYTLRLIPFGYVDKEEIDKIDPQMKSKKKVKAIFHNGVENNEKFFSIMKNTYSSVAWKVAHQINYDLISELITNNSAPTKNFDAREKRLWSETSYKSMEVLQGIKEIIKYVEYKENCKLNVKMKLEEALNDIRTVAKDIESNEGYKLKIILLHTENYYELFSEIDDSDYELPPHNDTLYSNIIHLLNPDCWVVGIPEGTSLKEGSILGIGTYQGILCISNYTYIDPNFSFKNDMNIPLNIDIQSKDEGTDVIAWINSKFKVTKPLGVFYKENVI